MTLLLSLTQATLTIAHQKLLDDANWQIHQGQRFALIGRNGAGKSSLLKVLQGQIVLDHGQCSVQKGLKITGLAQDFNNLGQGLVYEDLLIRIAEQGVQISSEHFSLENDKLVLKPVYHEEGWLVAFAQECNHLCQILKIDLKQNWSSLSGGMKRRIALAAAILAKPQLLLLDEPTNHLDIHAIMWLENYLLQFKGAVVFVTHDRLFLQAVANSIVGLEHGKLKQYDLNYEAYLNQREAELAAIDHENQRLRHKLAAEEHWLQRGVTARRTRNQGRLAALMKLRETVAKRQATMGAPGHWNPDLLRSGRVILTADHLNYGFEHHLMLKDFSLMLMRGDKIGIVGPNGCGKTTLARILLGELAPHSGTISHGPHLSTLYFDQMQQALDLSKTLVENIAQGTEYVEGPDGKQHVASYLKQFMFYPDQFHRPVYTLSGGERQRLMLAKCLLDSAHLMVLDEPSNDLDLETLEHLSAMLVNFSGSFILISHDRALVADVVTRLLVWKAPGVFQEILPQDWDPKARMPEPTLPSKKTSERSSTKPSLSYAEQKELLKLPDEISKLEAKIEALHEVIAEPGFYQADEAVTASKLAELANYEKKLSQCYQRWEYLETLQQE